MNGRWSIVGLAGLLAAYVGLAGWVVPPIDDELYYWCWAKDLQLSYYDHPPLTAYLIRASTAVFGDSLAAVRLPACVASVVVVWVIGRLTSPRGFALAALLTPVFTAGAVVVTPDTPLLLFWSLYLFWLVSVHRRLTPTDGREPRPVPVSLWLLGGAALGCGLLGKYTAGLLVPAGGFSFLLLGRGNVRRWAAGYALHLLAAAAVFSPVIAYNAQRGFEPLLYQWGHATDAPLTGLKSFGEFVGVQVVLVGTLPFVLLPWVMWRWKDLSADPRLRACLCLYALPTGFFTLKSLTSPMEGNWALAGYVGFWPVAAHWLSELNRVSPFRRAAGRLAAKLAFAIPATATVALLVHLTVPLPFVSPADDRVTRARDKEVLIERAAEAIRDREEKLPVFAADYQLVALLRFHGIPAEQEAGVTRPSHFTRPERRMADHPAVYYFGNFPPPPDHAEGFGEPEGVAEFPLVIRGEWVDTHKLWVYRRADGPPPDPRVFTAARPRP